MGKALSGSRDLLCCLCNLKNWPGLKLAHRQWLADNDLVVQTRIMSGDPYPDPYEVEEMEVTE